MLDSLAAFVVLAIPFGIFAGAAVFFRGYSERRVRAHFSREGTVLRIRRVGAFADRRRIQEFRVQVRLPDGLVVTRAAEIEGWGPIRRLW